MFCSSATKAEVIALSNITGSGFDAFQQTSSPGKTYCLLASSGVGKTKLINRLIDQEAFHTSAVSAAVERGELSKARYSGYIKLKMDSNIR